MKVVVKKLLRTGVVPARAWRAHVVEIAPTERLKLRRQLAAAAGKESTSLSFYGLAVEEELSTMATQAWAEGAWIGKWQTEDEAYFRGSGVERTWRSCSV